MNIKPVLAFMLIALCACTTKITSYITSPYPALQYDEEVIVFGLKESPGEEYQIIGTAKAGDSGASVKCNFDYAIDQLKLEARKYGGNAIKITSHKTPDLWSSCHRIEVNVLKKITDEN